MEALERGATDFIAKIGAFHAGEPSVFFCESVLEKCRVAVGIWGNRSSFEEVGRHLPLDDNPYDGGPGDNATRLICIGASTGGPGLFEKSSPNSPLIRAPLFWWLSICQVDSLLL